MGRVDSIDVSGQFLHLALVGTYQRCFKAKSIILRLCLYMGTYPLYYFRVSPLASRFANCLKKCSTPEWSGTKEPVSFYCLTCIESIFVVALTLFRPSFFAAYNASSATFKISSAREPFSGTTAMPKDKIILPASISP